MIQKIKQWIGTHKRLAVVIMALLIALVAGGVYAYAAYSSNVARTDPRSSGGNQPALKMVASPLTGVEVAENLAERPVTGVMIENSPEARPQSGLRDGGVVFEAIAEGGITRFLVLYQEAQPKLIGPVRSLRPYYFDWAFGFDASVAHVGGSQEALQLARNTSGFRDLDQFFNSQYFFRSTDRYAPHNVYTRMKLLDQASKAKGYSESDFSGFARKKAEPAESPTVRTITVDFSSPLFKAGYSYNKRRNVYKRSLAGKPHIDRESKKQIAPSVVVVMKINWSVDATGHSIYGTTAGGQALIFQDGLVTKSRWSKASSSTALKFTDAAGKPIKLNPGQTWIEALPNSRSVHYE